MSEYQDFLHYCQWRGQPPSLQKKIAYTVVRMIVVGDPNPEFGMGKFTRAWREMTLEQKEEVITMIKLAVEWAWPEPWWKRALRWIRS